MAAGDNGGFVEAEESSDPVQVGEGTIVRSTKIGTYRAHAVNALDKKPMTFGQPPKKRQVAQQAKKGGWGENTPWMSLR